MAYGLDAQHIEIQSDTFNNLRFETVDTRTINIVSNDFDLGILDIDTFVVESAEEFNILFPAASDLVTESDQLDITATAQSAALSLTASEDISNLENLSNLSIPQEDLDVGLDTSSFDRNFDSSISSIVGNRSAFININTVLNNPTTSVNSQSVSLGDSSNINSDIGSFDQKRFSKLKVPDEKN